MTVEFLSCAVWKEYKATYSVSLFVNKCETQSEVSKSFLILQISSVAKSSVCVVNECVVLSVWRCVVLCVVKQKVPTSLLQQGFFLRLPVANKMSLWNRYRNCKIQEVVSHFFSLLRYGTKQFQMKKIKQKNPHNCTIKC